MQPQSRPIRVIIAKPGLDGHDRGAKVLVQALRDSGMEVIYTGLHQSPQQIARIAMQEDADVVGLSILNGAHDCLCRSVVEELRSQGMDDVLLIAGGTINQKDAAALKDAGVAEVFASGSRFEDIVAFIRDRVLVMSSRSTALDREAGHVRGP